MGLDLFKKIRESRVLVVGAGGIGCELLKNLVLTGFKEIEIIDLDTIDLSNLNRQFLFRKQHIGKSKALVAKESALKFNPHVNITSHHGNIKSSEFGPQYFSQFSLVMNALDNQSARKHVNRICLASNIPLIESGTAGYLGQVSVHIKKETECYECQPKPQPKTYAVCTIRSNPSLPIHCIIWAKYLFGRIFGKAEDSNAVTDLEEDLENGNTDQGPEAEQNKPKEEEDSQWIKDEKLQLQKEKEKGFANFVFYKVFHTDILRLSKMKDLWKDKQPPLPLLVDSINAMIEQTSTQTGVLRDQVVWSVKQCATAFFECVHKLQRRRETEKEIEFDKDDEDALNFVTAASNLRSHIFGLQLLSKFDVKEKAGNIIPAIATTNAIIAGLIVIEAIKILQGKPETCKATYLLRKASNKKVLLSVPLEKPSKNCFICGNAYIPIKIDTNKVSLGYFIDKILINHFGFNEPSIDTGSKFFEGGSEGLSDEEIEIRNQQLPKKLSEVDIRNDSIISISDMSQDLTVNFSIIHCDEEEFGDSEQKFEVIGDSSIPAPESTPKPSSSPAASSSSTSSSSSSSSSLSDGPLLVEDDDLLIVDKPLPSSASEKKRKRDEIDEAENSINKRPSNTTNDSEVIVD